ncbi:putative transcriptional regulator [Pseudomonas aeruginosa PA38182]|nr:putative transcriptional regulator [Pseudomonas aeruginosa PA38182]
MDSLSGFTVFVRVAETRSIVGAARTLGVSASAVGKRVARLEEKLGVRLFHRSTRSITLTAEGSLFLERSRRILAEIEATELELSQSRETPRGACGSACRWSAGWSCRRSPISCRPIRTSS